MNGDFKYKIYLYFGIKQEEMFDESCILIPLLLSLMKINLIFTDTIPILFKYIYIKMYYCSKTYFPIRFLRIIFQSNYHCSIDL